MTTRFVLSICALSLSSSCDYKGPTALKQTVADMLDASAQTDPAGDAASTQTAVKTSAACDQLYADNKHIESQAIALEPTCTPHPSVVDSLRWCRSTPSADVGIRFARMHVVPASSAEDPCDVQARVELVHIDRKNARVGTPLGTASRSGSDTIDFDDVNGWKWDVLGPPVSFDFDGDGEPEVLIAGTPPGPGADEWQGYEWHEAWTFRNGAWRKYAPLAKWHFSKIEDVDHDGRPDLRTRGGYDAIAVISGMPTPQSIIEPLFVLHSLANGDFSANDSVAKKAANDACAGASRFPFSKSGHGLDQRDALAVACARMHGQSSDDVVKKLATTCKAYFDDVSDIAPDHCPAWAKQIATAPPQLTLP